VRMRIDGVDVAVLDGVYPPSEDTFLLIDAIRGVRSGRALEVCCGTGAVGLVAAGGAGSILEVDADPHAVANARLNFDRNGLGGRADFAVGDLFACVRGRFDLILMNPPYLPEGEGDAPDLAWSGGPRGRAVIDRFIDGLGGVLEEGGRAFFLQASLCGEGETAGWGRRGGLEGMVVLRRGFQFEELAVIEAFHAGSQKD